MPKKSQKKTQKNATGTTVKKPAARSAVRPKTAQPATTSKRAPAASKKTAKPTAKTARSASQKSTALAEGALAPFFTLQRDGGQSVSLADLSGKKVVLFFYPRADTPGCTLEAIDFSRLAKEFAASGTAVLGVSADSVKKQESFRNKHKLSVPLLSDEQQIMLKRYDVWGEKSMYGKIFMGIVRTTVLIERDGRIARIWRNVRVDGHANEVLAAAKAL